MNDVYAGNLKEIDSGGPMRHFLCRKYFLALFMMVFVLVIGGGVASAYTVVEVSTSAPLNVENAFLATTTAQFLTTLSVNPLFRNTYHVELFGINPNFNPSPTNSDLLNAVVTVDSWTYAYGWADGESYERAHDLSYFTAPLNSLGMPNGGFFVNCSSPSFFNGLQVSSNTEQLMNIDSMTCTAVLSAVSNFIYQQFFSTPTVVPGNFQ